MRKELSMECPAVYNVFSFSRSARGADVARDSRITSFDLLRRAGRSTSNAILYTYAYTIKFALQTSDAYAGDAELSRYVAAYIGRCIVRRCPGIPENHHAETSRTRWKDSMGRNVDKQDPYCRMYPRTQLRITTFLVGAYCAYTRIFFPFISQTYHPLVLSSFYD